MRHTTFSLSAIATILVLATMGVTSQAQPAPQPVPSRITHATIYLSGAQVTRSADIQLRRGVNTVVFEGLSSQLQPRSLQLRTDRAITLLSISKNIDRDEINSALLDSLIGRKAELQRTIDMAGAEQQVLQRELEILMANKELRGGSEKISATELRQAMDYFREKLKDIESERLAVRDRQQEAKEELQKVEQRINEVRNEARKRAGQVIAEIESPSSQNVALELSYFINSAGWYPTYDVRVEDVDQPLNLSYKANVFQNSGIDWKEVRLSISSAQPLASSTLPSLSPDYLSFLDEAARRQYESARKSAAELRAMDVVQQEQAQNMPGPPAQVQQNQTSFSFDIEVPYSVSGDGSAMSVTVQSHSLPASYRYFAAPKVRKEAYLTAHLSDWEELNLLNGEINLYFGNTYVGKSQLLTQTAEDSLEFSMGRDPSVVIERNRLQELTEKNFFGNRVRETKAWELVVKNTKQKPIDITLVDQIPVSTHEDISVELQQSSGASLEKSTGKLTWKFSVSPGESEKRTFRYQVGYPSGRKLNQ